MIQISGYSLQFRRDEVNMIFVKYDNNLVKVYINNTKPVIITYEEIANNPELFEYYMISVINTENIYNLDKDEENKWCLSARIDNKRMFYSQFYDVIYSFKRNPLNQQEPKRISSEKKIKKFYKQFKLLLLSYEGDNFYFNYMPENLSLFNDYLYKEFEFEINIIEEDTRDYIKYKKNQRLDKVKNSLLKLYNIPDDLITKIKNI